MPDFKEEVPFDPGYSPISFSFIENISILNREYKSLKAPHQKKFWLVKFEPTIIDLINKSTAFYLGCILWGGFLSCRFKDSPKAISGNTTNNLTQEELKELDCAVEVKAIAQYLQNFDRDCKYFLKKPAKVPDFIPEVLESYIEFAEINNNFAGVQKTSDVKILKSIAHFEILSNEQLDNLCEKIYDIIKSSKIETLLDLKFYNIA